VTIRRTFILAHDQARKLASQACQDEPNGVVVVFREPTRSLEQNAAQWPYLQGFAEQKQACINGVMQWVTRDDWKDILTGVYRGEVRMAVFDGKAIMLPLRTSKMGKRVFSDWMEFLVAMAAQCGIEPVYKSEREPASC